jgi:hypothetical protein
MVKMRAKIEDIESFVKKAKEMLTQKSKILEEQLKQQPRSEESLINDQKMAENHKPEYVPRLIQQPEMPRVDEILEKNPDRTEKLMNDYLKLSDESPELLNKFLKENINSNIIN